MSGLKTIRLSPQEMVKGPFKAFPYCLEMLENQGVFQRSKKNKIDFLPELGERAGREDVMHGYIRQALNNLEAYIWKLHQKNEFQLETVTFLPIIVTNANLYSLQFNPEQIDVSSDLKDFSEHKQEKFLCFNFSDSIKYEDNKGFKEIVTDFGDYEKSVFIVNIKYVLDFIECVRKL